MSHDQCGALVGEDATSGDRQVSWGRIGGILVVQEARSVSKHGILVVPKARFQAEHGILVVRKARFQAKHGIPVVQIATGFNPWERRDKCRTSR